MNNEIRKFLRGDDLAGMDRATRAGYRAAQHHDQDENPFPRESGAARDWSRGWLAAANPKIVHKRRLGWMFDSLSERLLAAALFLGVPLSFALHGYDVGYYVEAAIFPDSTDWKRVVFGIVCAPTFFVLAAEATREALERLHQL